MSDRIQTPLQYRDAQIIGLTHDLFMAKGVIRDKDWTIDRLNKQITELKAKLAEKNEYATAYEDECQKMVSDVIKMNGKLRNALQRLIYWIDALPLHERAFQGAREDIEFAKMLMEKK